MPTGLRARARGVGRQDGLAGRVSGLGWSCLASRKWPGQGPIGRPARFSGTAGSGTHQPITMNPVWTMKLFSRVFQAFIDCFSFEIFKVLDEKYDTKIHNDLRFRSDASVVLSGVGITP